jgi:hypothetical protein
MNNNAPLRSGFAEKTWALKTQGYSLVSAKGYTNYLASGRGEKFNGRTLDSGRFTGRSLLIYCKKTALLNQFGGEINLLNRMLSVLSNRLLDISKEFSLGMLVQILTTGDIFGFFARNGLGKNLLRLYETPNN